MPGTAFISGASRGIGLALAERVLKTTQLNVIATSRTALVSPGLASLSQQFAARLKVAALDLTREDSIQEAASILGNEPCPLLIHAAALMHPSGKGENGVTRLSGTDMGLVMATNVIGPALLTKALWPALRKTAKSADGASAPPSKVMAIGAGVGSVGTNAAGGWYSYRISKTALNALMKNLSIEGRRANIWTTCLYPEMVDTEFAAPYVKNNPYPQLRTPEEVAIRMMEILDGMEKEDSGRFVNLWTGADIPY